MDIVFYLVVAAVVVVLLLFQIRSKNIAPARAPVSTKPPTVYVPPTADEIMTQLQEHEARFLKDIRDKYPARVERHFYVKLAGTSHRNPDRTSRTAAIAKCDRGEELWLEHQAENKYDSNAIAVYSLGVDRQLGYLPARLAGETVRASQRGYSHALYFAHENREPETDRVVGATCLYLRLMPSPTGDLIVEEEKGDTRNQPPAPCA